MKKKNVQIFAYIAIVLYLILAFTNWAWTPEGWNETSRVVYVVVLLISLANSVD